MECCWELPSKHVMDQLLALFLFLNVFPGGADDSVAGGICLTTTYSSA